MNPLYCDCGEIIGTVRPATQEEPAEAMPWNEDLFDAELGYVCRSCFERRQEQRESEAA